MGDTQVGRWEKSSNIAVGRREMTKKSKEEGDEQNFGNRENEL